MARRNKRYFSMPLVLVFVVAACTGSACAGSDALTVSGTGTIQHLDFEGGFYGIVADDGAKYDPSKLPKEFQQDGLRVKFTVNILEGMATIRMWGTPVEVVSIERL